MTTEICNTVLNINQALKHAKECGHKSFQVEVTTSNNKVNTSSAYYYVSVDNPVDITDNIRYIMNFLFDILGYTGHDVDISDVSEEGYHARQITVRF
jgi:hypothetical protein